MSANLEMFVRHDLFLCATSRFADYLPPAAHWLEKLSFLLGGTYIASVGDVDKANHRILGPGDGHRIRRVRRIKRLTDAIRSGMDGSTQSACADPQPGAVKFTMPV